MTTGELPPELRKIPFLTVISMEVIEHLTARGHSPPSSAASSKPTAADVSYSPRLTTGT
ncbi:MAG: hypothetical protein ACLRM8_08735 [Alistipes sp.]